MTRQRLLVFFYIEGIVRREFVPRGQTVNRMFYKDEVRERIRKNWPEN